MNCSYQELIQISKFSEDELKNRIEILQIDSESKNSLKTKIDEKMKYFNNIKDKLIEVKDYLKKMEITNNEDKIFNQRINCLNSAFTDEKTLQNTLQKIDTILNKEGLLIKLNKIYERAKKFQIIEQFECGKMFIQIVETKLEKEEIKFEEIISNLNEMKQIFEKETLFQMNEGKFIKFLNLFNNEESFLQELKKLKEFFGIEDKENDEIIEYLKFNFRKEITKNIALSYMNTIKILNLKIIVFTNLQNIINRINELESNNKEIDKEKINNNMLNLNKIIIDFELIGNIIQLKISPLDEISVIIKNLWNNGIFEFLFKITNNDIRDLNNSLTGTSVDINDINNYLIVKQLIIIFKKEANYHP